MDKNIYVGNLPYSTTEDEIREFFIKYGNVKKVNLIKDQESGKSRGFCFVEMSNITSEEIREMDGLVIGDRSLVINEADKKRKMKMSNKKVRSF